MTDPLGQSQVINYLIGLQNFGYQFDILSFEKADKFVQLEKKIGDLLSHNNIKWHPQVFHTSPPIVSKIYDKLQLFSTAKKLHKKYNYDLIHCRSYAAAEAGLRLKRNTGVKFLFDMRGFWADEKADGGAWNRKKWFWNKVYNFYKQKEVAFIKEADHIISLTRAAKTEMESWSFYDKKTPITVIPCCADSNLFAETSIIKKAVARKELNISNDIFVLSYLGSLGAWYMIDEMLQFFSALKKIKPSSLFLFVTNSNHDIIFNKLQENNLQRDDVKIITVPFTQVPQAMYASDISISFIKPVYSKMSSSPVKVGEVLSMGIPIIANNIGDSGTFINENNVGYMLQTVSEKEIEVTIQLINNNDDFSSNKIREVALGEYSLQKGVDLYKTVYEQLFSK
jgi:glycosyltransferase involved in cell wall biosynthesis